MNRIMTVEIQETREGFSYAIFLDGDFLAVDEDTPLMLAYGDERELKDVLAEVASNIEGTFNE